MVAYAEWGWHTASAMCNLYSITTNQAAIIALFRVINRYVGNLPPMTGVFPDFPAPVIRNTDTGRELAMMRWGIGNVDVRLIPVDQRDPIRGHTDVAAGWGRPRTTQV